MTPEQLAECLEKEPGSGRLTVYIDDAAAELRRLAVENEALRAESLRFREDALNEKAARRAIEAALAERQGEAVATPTPPSLYADADADQYRFGPYTDDDDISNLMGG